MYSSIDDIEMNIFQLKDKQVSLADEVIDLRKRYRDAVKERSELWDAFKVNDELGTDIVLITKRLTDIDLRLFRLQDEEKEKNAELEKITRILSKRIEYNSGMFQTGQVRFCVQTTRTSRISSQEARSQAQGCSKDLQETSFDDHSNVCFWPNQWSNNWIEH